MAQLIYSFALTIPAGTPINSPCTLPMQMPTCEVTRLDIRIPAGPQGCAGFSIGAAGTPVIPVNAGGWIVGNDDRYTWDLENIINSGSWQFFGYNVGNNPHTIYLIFHCNPISNNTSTATAPITVEGGE